MKPEAKKGAPKDVSISEPVSPVSTIPENDPNKEKAKDINDKIDKLLGSVNTLTEKFGTFKEEFGTFKKEVNKRFDKVDKDISSMKTDISNMKTDINKMDEKIDNNNRNLRRVLSSLKDEVAILNNNNKRNINYGYGMPSIFEGPQSRRNSCFLPDIDIYPINSFRR